MTLRPGYGTDRLNLRMRTVDLLDLYGKPEKRRKSGSFREYWLYPAAGFDCMISRRSHRILSIFLRPDRALVDDALIDATDEGIERIFGLPARKGGAVPNGAGGFLDGWYSYDCGLGFLFDASHRVRTVVVFNPKRKAKSKPAVSHIPSRSQDLAALRS